MATMPVEIIDLSRNPDSNLAQAVKSINDLQDQYFIKIADSARASELEWSVKTDTNVIELRDAVEKAKTVWRGYHPYVMCYLDTPINGEGVYNLFSGHEENFAVFTTSNVTDVLIPADKIQSYIAFEIAIHLVGFSAGSLPWHHLGNACVFDYREQKTLIKNAIKEIHVCDQCRTAMQQLGKMSPSQMSAVFSILKNSSVIYKNKKEVRMNREKIFIGSSAEGLTVAQSIQSQLDHEHNVEIWNQSAVFGLGTSTLEALESAVSTYSFAIFIFTPDDLVRSRKKSANAPRDNVIFEAGLFIGRLGRNRTFLVRPREAIQMPSDLHGITMADYDTTNDNLVAALGTACSKIRAAIKQASTLRHTGSA